MTTKTYAAVTKNSGGSAITKTVSIPGDSESLLWSDAYCGLSSVTDTMGQLFVSILTMPTTLSGTVNFWLAPLDPYTSEPASLTANGFGDGQMLEISLEQDGPVYAVGGVSLYNSTYKLMMQLEESDTADSIEFVASIYTADLPYVFSAESSA